MPWFKPKEKSDASEFTYDPNRETSPPLPSAGSNGIRFRIRIAVEIPGLGDVLLGEVESGTLCKGQKLTLQPGPKSKTKSKPVEVVSLHIKGRQEVLESGQGTTAGLIVNGMGPRDCRRGDYLVG